MPQLEKRIQELESKRGQGDGVFEIRLGWEPADAAYLIDRQRVTRAVFSERCPTASGYTMAGDPPESER